jgi:hypothetical protein
VDQADHYQQLALLGLDAFVASAAPAALVRARPDSSSVDDDVSREASVDLESETMVAPITGSKRRVAKVEVYPLAKKPGASFPDMITVGRTPNNDVVLRDVTVSRLHAFFRHRDKKWVIADGGSKNGTRLDGVPLEPRRERDVESGQLVRIGDLELTFYTAAALFHVLGG